LTLQGSPDRPLKAFECVYWSLETPVKAGEGITEVGAMNHDGPKRCAGLRLPGLLGLL